MPTAACRFAQHFPVESSPIEPTIGIFTLVYSFDSVAKQSYMPAAKNWDSEFLELANFAGVYFVGKRAVDSVTGCGSPTFIRVCKVQPELRERRSNAAAQALGRVRSLVRGKKCGNQFLEIPWCRLCI